MYFCSMCKDLINDWYSCTTIPALPQAFAIIDAYMRNNQVRIFHTIFTRTDNQKTSLTDSLYHIDVYTGMSLQK